MDNRENTVDLKRAERDDEWSKDGWQPSIHRWIVTESYLRDMYGDEAAKEYRRLRREESDQKREKTLGKVAIARA